MSTPVEREPLYRRRPGADAILPAARAAASAESPITVM